MKKSGLHRSITSSASCHKNKHQNRWWSWSIQYKIDFNLTVPTPYLFLIQFLKAVGPDRAMEIREESVGIYNCGVAV
jgi:hypothetical protein